MVSETEKKFWGCPKLMEKLLPFLDTYSIICLAKVNTLSKILNTLSQVPNSRSQISKILSWIPRTPYPIPISFSHPFLDNYTLHYLPCSGPQACPRPCPGPNCLAQANHEGVQLEEGNKGLQLGKRVPTTEDPGDINSHILQIWWKYLTTTCELQGLLFLEIFRNLWSYRN